MQQIEAAFALFDIDVPQKPQKTKSGYNALSRAVPPKKRGRVIEKPLPRQSHACHSRLILGAKDPPLVNLGRTEQGRHWGVADTFEGVYWNIRCTDWL